MNNRAGEFVTNLSGKMAYKSFKPSPLPPVPPIDTDSEMVEYLVEANKQIAVIESIAKRIPNVNLFVSMYVRKEALLSSQIEGTQCTLDDVLNPLITENANRDVSDVINYIKATEFAVKRLETLPLCTRFIKETHAVLLSDVRGSEKNPGELRNSQNWIGGSGSTLKNARYIPPNVEDMKAAMSELEKFINSDCGLDPLICAALIHYQFETIHPFLDGNGRVGRLLITLYLMEKKILSTPALYISYFLKKNRIEYYDRMTEVRRNGNYEQWIKFFLHGIIETCEDGIKTIESINSLIKMDEKKLVKKTETISKVFDYIKEHPIITIGGAATALNLSFNGVSNAVKKMVEVNILKEMTTKARDRVFEYTSYIDILKSGT